MSILWQDDPPRRRSQAAAGGAGWHGPARARTEPCPGPHASRGSTGAYKSSVTRPPPSGERLRCDVDDDQDGRVRLAISAERLAPYDAACGGDRTAALRLYSWNAEVAGAFLGPLHCLEVVMRNAIHREFSILLGRPDWWDAANVDLHPAGARMVEEARQELVRHRKPAEPDRMVAELRFGFWVALLGKGRDYEMRFWRPGLYRAFPGLTGPRGPLYDQINSVRLLRNRIAHYESIHQRHLAADHEKIMRLIAAISPETADFTRRRDRVPAVLARRADVCDGSAPASF